MSLLFLCTLGCLCLACCGCVATVALLWGDDLEEM